MHQVWQLGMKAAMEWSANWHAPLHDIAHRQLASSEVGCRWGADADIIKHNGCSAGSSLQRFPQHAG